MKADLHVHSNYSDGSNTVEEIMEMAEQKGITHISLVDHDTVQGIEHAQEAGASRGITVIPAVEISAYDFKRNRKVHILGYAFNKEAEHIQRLCTPLLQRRHENSLWQVEQLQRNGFQVELDEVKKQAAQGGIIYKQHIMACLTDAHFSTQEYKHMYKSLFKGDGICARDIKYVDANDAVKAIKRDGGYAVLAHPGQLDSFDMIPELVQSGLDGIERNHYDHIVQDIVKVESYAAEYRLFMTGGSDYHGDFGTPIEIGDFDSPVKSIQLLFSNIKVL
ncbi:MAG TPA: PHP domain-containing protein [Bacillus bacterium]|uniref:PHP domain-containing protein n=1 Tax=Siminovitchia fordii TaxID=254759 RepID=UPI0003717D03|nr:PHP domain-containing protein [Siminovitchia fordii]HBZ11790.1 PHP domain-containing protein [Bacillus sp. (in: firmicutes)]